MLFHCLGNGSNSASVVAGVVIPLLLLLVGVAMVGAAITVSVILALVLVHRKRRKEVNCSINSKEFYVNCVIIMSLTIFR